jgi:hypothetical protein
MKIWLILYSKSSGVDYLAIVSDSIIATSTWTSVSITYDGSGTSTGLKLYIDGELEKEGYGVGDYEGLENYIGTFRLAAPFPNLYYYGTMDEPRVSNTVRSAAWIKTEFYNQSTSSDFYGIGDEQSSTTDGSASSTVWKYDGTSWGSPSTSQTTGSGSDGKIPTPGTAGAIRIREYVRDNVTSTYYKYNLHIDWQTNYGEYDYYNDQGDNYLASASSTEVTGVDRTISQNDWHRNASSTMNDPYTCPGASGNDCINEPPTNGSWYLGMLSGLTFQITTGLSVDFGTLDTSNNWTATANSTLQVSTSASNGYVVTAWATNDGRLKLEGLDYYIQKYNAINSAPREWDQNCNQNSQCCGFGYNTGDNTLSGGGASRFTQGTDTCSAAAPSGTTAYASFASSGPGDPVADSSNATSSDQRTVTYKVSTDSAQAAGDYQTTVIYVCTANY